MVQTAWRSSAESRQSGQKEGPQGGARARSGLTKSLEWLSGTDATHAEHIETIKARMYVGLTPDKRFLPGHLGMGLVEGKERGCRELGGRGGSVAQIPSCAVGVTQNTALPAGYDSMGYEMSKPDLRAELEADLKLICEGRKDKSVVLRQQIQKYRTVFTEAVAKAKK